MGGGHKKAVSSDDEYDLKRSPILKDVYYPHNICHKKIPWQANKRIIYSKAPLSGA